MKAIADQASEGLVMMTALGGLHSCICLVCSTTESERQELAVQFCRLSSELMGDKGREHSCTQSIEEEWLSRKDFHFLDLPRLDKNQLLRGSLSVNERERQVQV